MAYRFPKKTHVSGVPSLFVDIVQDGKWRSCGSTGVGFKRFFVRVNVRAKRFCTVPYQVLVDDWKTVQRSIRHSEASIIRNSFRGMLENLRQVFFSLSDRIIRFVILVYPRYGIVMSANLGTFDPVQ